MSKREPTVDELLGAVAVVRDLGAGRPAVIVSDEPGRYVRIIGAVAVAALQLLAAQRGIEVEQVIDELEMDLIVDAEVGK